MVSDTPHYENEVPFEVPESWEWTTLGEITNYGNCENVDVNDIPSKGWILELEDLEKDSAKIIQRLTKDERDIKGVRHSFHKGDVLYSKLRTYLNKVLVADEDGFCTTEIIPVTSMASVLPEYLNHVLRSKYFVDYTVQCGYGVKMPRLSTTDACNGQIPLPPYNEQKHIVASIEGWFQIIDLLETAKEDLQTSITQAKSKILDLAIHGKLVPQDPNDEPAIELLKRINPKFTPCDNAHYPFFIPETWKWSSLENISTDSADGPFGSNLKKEHYTSKKEVRIIQLSNIGDEGWRDENTKYTTFEHLKEISRSEVNPNDIVIAKMMPAGRAILCPNFDQKYVLSSDAVKFHINNEIYYKYILYAINSDVFRDQVYDNVQGVTRIRTSLQKLRKYVIPLPPYNEQQRIVAKIEELFAVLDEIQKSIEA